MWRVAILYFDNALVSSMILPLEMLQAARDIWRLRHKTDSLHTQIVMLPGERPHNNIPSASHQVLTENDQWDLLILPAIWRRIDTVISTYMPRLAPLLLHFHRHGSVICATSNSSFLLAETGMLNGHKATTHWYYFMQFADRYPKVQLQRHHFITRANKIYCAGSVNALADLMVHIIELFYDRDTARRVESQFSPEIRQSFPSDAHLYHHDELVAIAQEHIQKHYNQPLHLQKLAHLLHITPRTLNRRFKLATDITPGEYLHQVRLNIARELMRESNLTIGEIARYIGYSNSSAFGKYFKQLTSLPPSQYRKSTRSKLFTPYYQSM